MVKLFLAHPRVDVNARDDEGLSVGRNDYELFWSLFQSSRFVLSLKNPEGLSQYQTLFVMLIPPSPHGAHIGCGKLHVKTVLEIVKIGPSVAEKHIK